VEKMENTKNWHRTSLRVTECRGSRGYDRLGQIMTLDRTRQILEAVNGNRSGNYREDDTTLAKVTEVYYRGPDIMKRPQYVKMSYKEYIDAGRPASLNDAQARKLLRK
jgi:hypothetical protein